METEKEPTIQDVLDVINAFAGNTQGRFEKIDERFDKIDERFEKLETKVTKIQSEMVTKTYLDDKLDDMATEIGGRINRRAEHENTFKHELVSAMKRNSVLGVKDLKQLEQAI